MSLEELIYQRLINTKELIKKLATYIGKPAIFSSAPPKDNQQEWEGGIQYPRLVYRVDLQVNREQNSVGILFISLYYQNTDKIDQKEIEFIIKACLRNILLVPENETQYTFSWIKTDEFIDRNEIQFAILEYPLQEILDLDPILGINKYLKELYPDSIVIGIDHIKAITEISKETIIFYCRLISVEIAEETNNVVWMDIKIAIHFLCPNHEVRLKHATFIMNRLSLDKEIILLDRSPMFLKHLQMDNQSDYLKDGQIFITGRYGLLRYQTKSHKLNQIKNQYR